MDILSTYRFDANEPYTHVIRIPGEEWLRWMALPNPPIDFARATTSKVSSARILRLTAHELAQLTTFTGDPRYQSARWHVYVAHCERRLPGQIANRVIQALDCYPIELTFQQFCELLPVAQPAHFGIGKTGLKHLRRVFIGTDYLNKVDSYAK